MDSIYNIISNEWRASTVPNISAL